MVRDVDPPLARGNHAPGLGQPIALAPVAVSASAPPSARAAPSPEMARILGLGRGAKVRALIWRVAKYAALIAVAVTVVRGVQRARRPAPSPTSTSGPRAACRRRPATGRVAAAYAHDHGVTIEHASDYLPGWIIVGEGLA